MRRLFSRMRSLGKNSRGRCGKVGSQGAPRAANGRRCIAELLELRCMLANGGVFTRIDSSNPGIEEDVWGTVDIGAATAGNLGYLDVSGIPDYDENFILAGNARSISVPHASAGATGHVGASLNGTAENNTQVVVPKAEIEGVVVTGAKASGEFWPGEPAEADAGASGYAELSGLFQYDDHDLDSPIDVFNGTLFFSGYGVGNESGNEATWHASGELYISVSIGDFAATVSVSHVLDAWTVVYGGDLSGLGTVTGQSSAFIAFSANIAEGDFLTIYQEFSEHGSSVVDADTDGQALTNFASIGTVFGYASEGPVPPPPNGQGDFDADGDVDGNDLQVWWLNQENDDPDFFDGDANLDGIIDQDDLAIWLANAPSDLIFVSDDSNASDGIYTLGNLSLREALLLAADGSHPGTDTIVIAPWIEQIDLVGTALAVTSNVNIIGSGAGAITVSGGGSSRVFTVSAGVTAAISGMTITGGQVTSPTHGGAIRNDGDLMLDSVVVTDNHATAFGGAIYNVGSAKLRIEDSTFTLNSAGSTGGAIYSDSSLVDALVIERSVFFDNEANTAGAIYLSGSDGLTGTVTISNSTFSGNRALASSGGAIKNAASAPPVTIINSTIAYNTSVSGGGGIDMHNNSDNRFLLHNTILAHNDATGATTDNLNRAVNSASSYNVIGYGGTSGLTDGVAGNDLLGSGISAGLATLGDYGGKTKTHALKVGSPALDKGSNDLALTYDQRGFVRDFNLPVTDGGDGYRDVGAYEAGEGTTLIVRSDGDRNDSVDLKATMDSLRLREAIALAAVLAGKSTIEFDESLLGETIELSGAFDQLTIEGDLEIVGPGADQLTIDANASALDDYPVFELGNDADVTISGLTITGGYYTHGAGGIHNAGNVSLIDARVTANVGTSGGGIGQADSEGDITLIRTRVDNNIATTGGGVYFSTVDGKLLIESSAIDHNSATMAGGIYAGGVIDFRNSTVSTNSATSVGGVYLLTSEGEGDSAQLINMTVAFNTASSGNSGGILFSGDVLPVIHNSIVAENFVASVQKDVYGSFDSDGSYNLIGVTDGSSGLAAGIGTIAGSISSGAADPLLDAFADYGGPTPTHALLAGSPALKNGGWDVADDFDVVEDQRGKDRIIDNYVDIGAFELAFEDIFQS